MHACCVCEWTSSSPVDQCGRCGAWRSVRRVPAPELARVVESPPHARWRGRADWDAALGGGFVAGSIVLVAGVPGAGKTCDALALASALGTHARPTAFALSEWSAAQLSARVAELDEIDGERIAPRHVEDVAGAIALARAAGGRCLVLDSWGGLASPPPADLDRLRSPGRVALVLCHVNKAGELAGREELAHRADAIVWVSREELRTTKNWHGERVTVPRAATPWRSVLAQTKIRAGSPT